MQRHNGAAPSRVVPVPVLGAAIPREHRTTTTKSPAAPFAAVVWKNRLPWLVVCFWTLVLTLAMIAHVMRNPTERDIFVHGYQRVVLAAKLNMALPLGGRPYTALLSYQLCCAMAGGHTECPGTQDVACHVMRDEGPRLACFWVASRFEGAACVIYWVAEK